MRRRRGSERHLSHSLWQSKRVIAAWVSACAAACSLDSSPREGPVQPRFDAGPRWRPIATGNATNMRSRAATGSVERMDMNARDADADTDAGALGDAAVRLDAASPTAPETMDPSAPQACTPGTQQCQFHPVRFHRSMPGPDDPMVDVLAPVRSVTDRNGGTTGAPSGRRRPTR